MQCHVRDLFFLHIGLGDIPQYAADNGERIEFAIAREFTLYPVLTVVLAQHPEAQDSDLAFSQVIEHLLQGGSIIRVYIIGKRGAQTRTGQYVDVFRTEQFAPTVSEAHDPAMPGKLYHDLIEQVQGGQVLCVNLVQGLDLIHLAAELEFLEYFFHQADTGKAGLEQIQADKKDQDKPYPLQVRFEIEQRSCNRDQCPCNGADGRLDIGQIAHGRAPEYLKKQL